MNVPDQGYSNLILFEARYPYGLNILFSKLA